MAILLTGGLGYIGSNIAKILSDDLVIIDDLSNSKLNYKKFFQDAEIIIEKITYASILEIFKKYHISCVIHLAGFKSVSDSIQNPLKYYFNNVNSTLELIKAMKKMNVNKLIYSSSATVYGNKTEYPFREDMNTSYSNPYGHTKLINEQIISEYCKTNPQFRAICLRYFNPIGSDTSHHLGDNPIGEPNNIMPALLKATQGKILEIYGDDYPTEDGTCVRDFIHVVDLAEAHLLSIKYLDNINFEIFNIGLGQGISILNLIKIFEKTNRIKINFQFKNRRDGDVGVSYADCSKAFNQLKWKPKYSYSQMCKDAWLSFINQI